MANKVLWEVESVATIMTAAELNNKADATLHLDGADYVNGTNKYPFAAFLFFGTFDAACNANAIIELHIFYKLDGTKYGDGEDGDVGAPQKSGNSLHGVFIIGAQADIYQQLLDVSILPFDFRVGLYLNTGQDLTPVDTHWLKICPYEREIQ